MDGFFAQPGKDEELAIAVRILSHETDVDWRVLDLLVGEPRRYADLRSAIGDRNDTVLTRSLARLRDDGVIEQRFQLASKQSEYRLTALGKLVVYRVQQMRPHHESIKAFQHGRAAADGKARASA